MSTEYERFPVRFDETKNSWVVKVSGEDIPCESEAAARSIASIPVLYREAISRETFWADEDLRQAFVESLKPVIHAAKSHGIRCVVSRELERVASLGDPDETR